METHQPRDFAYFQANRADADVEDPFGERAFFAAIETLDNPREIIAFLGDYLAWRKQQQPPPDKDVLRTMITTHVADLTKEITISYGDLSTTKTIGQVWMDAMNAHPFLSI